LNKIILVPDSFKGTMSSRTICGIMERAIRARFPNAEIISVPVADGGEGSVDAFLAAAGGEPRTAGVSGPFFEDVEAFYGVLPDGKTAVLEMAACAGLPLVGENRNPLTTTTYGVGQLVKHALDAGCEKIIIGLGGSATNDAGCGAAAALGAKFMNHNGVEFVPVGGTLSEVARIDLTGVDIRLGKVDLVTMCDIDNPLYGPAGAAYVFGPQKGATPEMVEILDQGLRNIAAVANPGAAAMPGAGSAGGMGYGMSVFLGSTLQMGIETVLDTVGFSRLLEGADLVLTGEGKLDASSLRGKVVLGVAARAAAAKIPLVAVVGDVGDGMDEVYGRGVSAVFSINRVAVPFAQAKLRAESDLYHTVDNIMRLILIQPLHPLFGGVGEG
jgi:glycerate kinase